MPACLSPRQHPHAMSTAADNTPTPERPAQTPTPACHPAILNLASMSRNYYPSASSNSLHFVFSYAVRSIHSRPRHSYLVSSSSSNSVRVQINACVERGLRFDVGRWVAYRRNFLSISASVKFDIPHRSHSLPRSLTSLLQPEPTSISDYSFTVVLESSDGRQIMAPVKHFAVSVFAEDDVTGKPIPLLQSTSKRDSGPRREPVISKIQPTLGDGRILAAPLSRPAPSQVTLDESLLFPPQMDFSDTSAQAGNDTSPEIVLYERIQFRHATANNGRKNTAQQTFRLVTVLYAAVDASEYSLSSLQYVEVQRVSTSGIMVRGRSPGHYTKQGLIQ